MGWSNCRLGQGLIASVAGLLVPAVCRTHEIIGLDGAKRAIGVEMTIDLKPEQERIIQAEIESGHFSSAEEVLDHALAALREKEHERKASSPRKNLAQFLMESPFAGAELNLERQKDFGRPVDL
jgi:Arc/MetJ-type ribon-helix-helix transcriptional regulator